MTSTKHRLPALALLIAIALLVTDLATVAASPPVMPGEGLASVASYPVSGLGLADALQPDPQVEAMIAQVNVASLRQYEEWLTGEAAVDIGGEPYTIATRYTHSGVPIQKATQFAYEHLDALGLDVAYHQWEGDTYPNVIATIEGLTNPEEIYILSAHLDSLPAGPAVPGAAAAAPGADDNASGSTGVLMAADILSQYEFGCTLKFALWTGEEQGMRGSAAWAEGASDQGLDIRGVLNMDMIAYDSDDSPAMDLHARESVTGSVALANLFSKVVDVYDLDLSPDVLVDDRLGNYSDNRSFWDEGYAAILAIEDYADFNPNYHTVNDRLSALNMPYMTEIVKASLATLVHDSDCLFDGGIGYLDGHVTEAAGRLEAASAPVAGATVSMRNAGGQIFQALSDGAGYYTRTLPAGAFSVTASAAGYQSVTITSVVVLSDTMTTQDFVLERVPEADWRLYLPLVQRGG